MNKIKYIALVIILILLILIVRSTYSKYVSDVAGTVTKDIAQWTIKVNDTDITILPEESKPEENNLEEGAPTESENTETLGVPFEITGEDLAWENGNHVQEGKIAPGTKGHFYLRIDPCNTQAAFKYTIKIDMAEILNQHIKFVIASIQDENGKVINCSRDGTYYVVERIKTLEETKSEDVTQKIDKIKVNFEWINDENLGWLDMKVAQNKDTVWKIPITIRAIQYTGEESTENSNTTTENTVDSNTIVENTITENTTIVE